VRSVDAQVGDELPQLAGRAQHDRVAHAGDPGYPLGCLFCH
jgi:hypothetical protein